MRQPVSKVFITQEFGVNPDSYARFGFKGHNGKDYRAFLPNGDRCYVVGQSEIFAPHNGTVIENAFDQDGYGWYIKIENDKEGSVLAHMNAPSSFKVGDTVKEGDLIGYQGLTGNTTGIHLHWGYYRIPRDRANGYGGMIDQRPYIKDAQGGTMSNMYGNPAISLPAGLIDGLPVSLQINGRHFSEQLLLDLGLALERTRPWALVAPNSPL
jgi:murein DD-endopeptidase MepM/ murein hydrolase activator NlpD